jgi:cell division protein FtsW
MPHPAHRLQQLTWHGLCLFFLLLILLQVFTLWQAPGRYWPQRIAVTLTKGESRMLGRVELAAAQAERQHIRITRTMDGTWQIQNLSGKQLLLQKGRQELRVQNGPVPATPLSADVQGLVLGHTAFRLQQQNGQLLLQPKHRIALFAAPLQALPEGIEWQWQAEPHWQMPPNGFSSLLLASAFLLLLAQRFPPSRPLAAGLLAACALWALLITPTLTQSLAMAALSGMMVLAVSRHRSFALALCLLSLGLLSQLELGLGGMESVWPAYYQKSCAVLGLALATIAMIDAFRHRKWTMQWSARPLTKPSQPSQSSMSPSAPGLPQTEAILFGLALLALTGMALEVVFGDETGVFGMQPVELAKTALIFLGAHALALWHGHALPTRALAWRVLWPILLLAAFISLALVQVSDYSPLLLLSVWVALSSLAWAVLNRQRWMTILLAAAICAVPLLIVALHLAWLPLPALPVQFYAARFLGWLEPTLHPHTGQQFLLGAQAIAEGGWLGADHHFGLTTLGAPLGALMHIPALQDDFAPAFFINRHGMGAALLLWLMQALLLCSLMQRASKAWQLATRLRDYRRVWHARFYCFGLIGASGFLFAQCLLSWSTNLGIFPVMGQPMSFLSSGGSHLLFFLLPLLGFTILCAPPSEE